jgi:hypothetical protein
VAQDENGQNKLENDGCNRNETAGFLVHPASKQDSKSGKKRYRDHKHRELFN